jgi:hypothetical protein
MSRFTPQLKAVWLACKRFGLPRDLRKVITNIVKKNIFKWETDALKEEKAIRLAFIYEQRRATRNICTSVRMHVERLPGTGQVRFWNKDMYLTCIYVRFFDQLTRWHWVWVM